MAINIGSNFKYLGKNFLDSRESFSTLEEMKKCIQVPDGFITYCQEDGKRYEFNSSNTINEQTGKWTEFFINQDVEDCYYLGVEEPDSDKIWFYNDRESSSVDITYDNPLITELFTCIQSLQAQITQLQAEVEYLKINGGGGIPVEPPDEEVMESCLILEDGNFFELEEGGYLLLEETPVTDSILLLEDGSELLLENGCNILIES